MEPDQRRQREAVESDQSPRAASRHPRDHRDGGLSFTHPTQFPSRNFFACDKNRARQGEENTIASLITSFLTDMTLPHETIKRCRNALDRNRSPYNSALQCESVRDLHDLKRR